MNFQDGVGIRVVQKYHKLNKVDSHCLSRIHYLNKVASQRFVSITVFTLNIRTP